MTNRNRKERRPSKKVVKRGEEAISGEVFENKSKINFKKCPKVPMLCEIMIL